VCAAERGAQVGLVDDNLALGGQIWRGTGKEKPPQAVAWEERLLTAEVTRLTGTRVFHQPQAGILLAEQNGETLEVRYDKLILATGARERFLAFPGWTLPNVMGAGGLQAMVKSGLPIRGKRVVVAGTGPLLLAVAAYLHKHGAEVPFVCEQASWRRLAAFAAGVARSPGKIAEALQLKKDLRGTRISANSWVVTAQGSEKLESVTVSRGGTTETVACDYLACGFHLVPNTEFAVLLGCEVRKGCVAVDENQQTTVAGVFCAGEPTGISGVEGALVEGQIAGLSAVGRTAETKKLAKERAKTRRFGERLERACQLRPELKSLPDAETVICRCEDVRYSRLQEHRSWRAAKLHTRCGMGPCQGRVCGPSTQFLFGWNPESVRPPIFPARVESLACVTGSDAAH
jgi:NADPH-dependent 2,4-dienoyl-CoA reductase/sulfur reductase-like enzyme